LVTDGGRGVGVLGSAFNPPHVGHLALAQEAHARLGLAEVLLVPTGRAPHKQIEDDPGPDVRLEMTRHAVAGDERLGVSELETSRDELSFSYRTLELLREQRPEEELVFVMGADAAAGLESWRSPQRILELARLGIAEREGVERAEVEAVLGRLGGAGRAEFLEMPHIEVSSTMVRERVGAGRPIRYLVPDPVVELIAERGLYAIGERERGLQKA
jgi:nicotinate-nucleotide adenylyltransferase